MNSIRSQSRNIEMVKKDENTAGSKYQENAMEKISYYLDDNNMNNNEGNKNIVETK